MSTAELAMSEANGFGASREQFATVLAFLDGAEAAALSHAELETRLQVERQAERLLSEVLVQSADPVVLVGHSVSCPVVVEPAVRSQMVVGLVLIGPVTDPRAVTWPRMLGQWLRTASHERPREVPVLVPQYLHTGVATMVRSMDAMRWYRTDQALARLGIPVVVVRGAQDRIASEESSARLSAIARRSLQTVGGAVHMVPLTHPEAVVAAVRDVTSAASTSGPRADDPNDHGDRFDCVPRGHTCCGATHAWRGRPGCRLGGGLLALAFGPKRCRRPRQPCLQLEDGTQRPNCEVPGATAGFRPGEGVLGVPTRCNVSHKSQFGVPPETKWDD